MYLISGISDLDSLEHLVDAIWNLTNNIEKDLPIIYSIKHKFKLFPHSPKTIWILSDIDIVESCTNTAQEIMILNKIKKMPHTFISLGGKESYNYQKHGLKLEKTPINENIYNLLNNPSSTISDIYHQLKLEFDFNMGYEISPNFFKVPFGSILLDRNYKPILALGGHYQKNTEQSDNSCNLENIQSYIDIVKKINNYRKFVSELSYIPIISDITTEDKNLIILSCNFSSSFIDIVKTPVNYTISSDVYRLLKNFLEIANHKYTFIEEFLSDIENIFPYSATIMGTENPQTLIYHYLGMNWQVNTKIYQFVPNSLLFY